MTAETATFDLPPVMKLEDCEQLFIFFEQSVGQPVAIRCDAVNRISGLAAQTLFIASEKWTQDGIEFALENASDGCRESLSVLGLSDQFFQAEAQA